MTSIDFKAHTIEQLKSMMNEISNVINEKTEEKKRQLIKILIEDLEIISKEFPYESFVHIGLNNYTAKDILEGIYTI